jgi:hypothetical protein
MNDNKKTKTKTTKAIISVARYAKERYWEDSSTTGVGRTLFGGLLISILCVHENPFCFVDAEGLNTSLGVHKDD